VGPLLEDGVDGFQADFSLLLGAGSAEPDHTAALSAGCLFIEDNFDHWAAPKFEFIGKPLHPVLPAISGKLAAGWTTPELPTVRKMSHCSIAGITSRM